MKRRKMGFCLFILTRTPRNVTGDVMTCLSVVPHQPPVTLPIRVLSVRATVAERKVLPVHQSS